MFGDEWVASGGAGLDQAAFVVAGVAMGFVLVGEVDLDAGQALEESFEVLVDLVSDVVLDGRSGGHAAAVDLEGGFGRVVGGEVGHEDASFRRYGVGGAGDPRGEPVGS